MSKFGCKYIVNLDGGQKLNLGSYTELLAYVENLLIDLTNFNDIVYSKVAKLQLQIEKIEKVKYNYEPIKGSGIDGEPGIKGRTSILDYLDSPDCAVNGKRLVTPLSREDYVKAVTAKLLEDTSSPRSEAECKAIAELIVKSWDIIEDDAMLLHQLYTDDFIHLPDKLAVDFINAHKDLIKDTRLDSTLLTNLFEGLRNNFYMREKGKYTASKNISNVNLVSEINGSTKKIMGHIDHLFVGEDGTLHLYLFKTTTEHPSQWARVKTDKYKYQLAFLKRMLANNGISVKNIDLNIVPVLVSYNDDFSKITNIRVLNTERFSSRYSGPEYAMGKYDKYVSALITDNTEVEHISSTVIDRANAINRAIFPELNLNRDGYLGLSARLWIARAPSADPTGTEPLVITENDEGYTVTINGTEHKITSRKEKNKNDEIFELVKNHVEEFEDYKGYTTLRIKDALRTSFKKGFLTFEGIRRFELPSRRLLQVFSKYFADYEEGDEDPVTKKKEKIFAWEMLEDTIDANVIIFKNKNTGEVDFVALSAFDINSKASFNKGDHVLGSYLMNTSSDRVDLDNDWGNIEAVRAMTLINEMVPALSDAHLGTLHVVSALGNNYFRSFNIGQFSKQHYLKILQVVNAQNRGLDAENHFVKADFVNPIAALLDEYQRATEHREEYIQNKFNYYGFDLLKDAEDAHLLIQTLQHIISQIFSMNREFQNPEDFLKALEGLKGFKRDLANLLDLSTKALGYLTGLVATNKTDWNPIGMWGFTSLTVPDSNVQTVVRNLQITHDVIASEFLQQFDRKMFDTYYERIGYSHALNMMVGNQASQFKNLFEVDLQGKKTMNFKNPYDYSNDLNSNERELLKQVLYKITWINTNGNFKFKDWKDSGIAEYIKLHPEYLWVPLIRASKATTIQSKDAILAKIRNGFKRLKNATERFDEFVNGMTPEERELFGPDNSNFYELRLKNPFELSMPSSNNIDVVKSRAGLLNKYGPEFFETNVENILIDFLVKHITTTLFNKMLIGTKAFLLQLHLTGDYGGNLAIVLKERDWLEKYLKVNVFNTTIMSELEKKVVGVILPMKRIVTHALVGGNLVGAVRDSLEGLQLNFIRSVIKLNTDLDPKNVAKAYAYVTTHSTTDHMKANLLSKLCLKYRLSNTDVGRIGERAKSGRNGIVNYENWLYSTLRCPDFINRMTLFVARCMLDGSWDAYSIDKDNNLKYDWKKDKRFAVYAQGLTSNPTYKESRARYLSAIRQYNMDNPDSPISPDDGLPDPYSRLEVMYIRNLGDNIYGSYDKGKKAMYEHLSAGVVLGMFTSWFNGIVNNYFMKALKNGAFGLLDEQERDEQGRPLFFDDKFNITTTDTGVKVYKKIPMIVQGIFPTIGSITKVFTHAKGGLGMKGSAVLEYLRADAHERANMLKLATDLSGWLINSLLYLLATRYYKEYKQNQMKENPLIANMLVEILYKGGTRAGEQYKGPLNVILFIGENMSPPTYSVPVQTVTEAMKFITGNKKAGMRVLYENSGIFRSTKDSWNALIFG